MHAIARQSGYALVFASLALLPCGALAKSALAFKTKAAVVSVEIDAALRKHPGLAEDCLAEGKRWGEKASTDADKEMHDHPDEFRDRHRWSLEREYEQRSVIGHYVSVVRSDYTYMGGAHPNTNIDTLLWDSEAKKRISIRPLLTDTADDGPAMTAMARLVRIAVGREKIERGAAPKPDNGKPLTAEELADQDQDIRDGVKPTLLGLGPVTLAPSTEANKSSGLTFHFSPYAVGSYAEGPYTAFVPWTKLKPYLSAEGTTLFGGERPEADKKE